MYELGWGVEGHFSVFSYIFILIVFITCKKNTLLSILFVKRKCKKKGYISFFFSHKDRIHNTFFDAIDKRRIIFYARYRSKTFLLFQKHYRVNLYNLLLCIDGRKTIYNYLFYINKRKASSRQGSSKKRGGGRVYT